MCRSETQARLPIDGNSVAVFEIITYELLKSCLIESVTVKLKHNIADCWMEMCITYHFFWGIWWIYFRPFFLL